MNMITRYVIAFVMLLLATQAHASDLIMVRSEQPFPETMSTLQEIIKQEGYVVSRVQRVDIGLTKMGYKTDKYRIVFFGKHDEYQKITDTYPELAAYLPLKIAIFSEGTETLLVTFDPVKFTDMFDHKDLRKIFIRWSKDVSKILHDVHMVTENQ